MELETIRELLDFYLFIHPENQKVRRFLDDTKEKISLPYVKETYILWGKKLLEETEEEMIKNITQRFRETIKTHPINSLNGEVDVIKKIFESLTEFLKEDELEDEYKGRYFLVHIQEVPR
jgi:hypothetical protein